MDEKDYPAYLDRPKPRKPMTNADRIRAMSDKELVEIYNGCPHPDPGEKCRGIKCNDCILEWLQQPAEVT